MDTLPAPIVYGNTDLVVPVACPEKLYQGL